MLPTINQQFSSGFIYRVPHWTALHRQISESLWIPWHLLRCATTGGCLLKVQLLWGHPGRCENQGNIPRVSQQKRANTIATHMWLRSCLATIQTQGLQRFSTTDWIIAAKSHTQSLRKQKMWTISWRISQLRKNAKCLRHVFPRKCLVFHAPGAQWPKGPGAHRSLLFFGGIRSREGDCLWGPEMLEAQQGPGSNT